MCHMPILVVGMMVDKRLRRVVALASVITSHMVCPYICLFYMVAYFDIKLFFHTPLVRFGCMAGLRRTHGRAGTLCAGSACLVCLSIVNFVAYVL